MSTSASSHPPSNPIPGLGLPVDVLYNIFCRLHLLDLLNVRQVSKQFREASKDFSVWRSVYANTRLPRSPGPFSWQSAQALESILVHSNRVARAWMSHASTIHLSHSLIPLASCYSWAILLDRCWACCKNQLVCFDLRTGSAQILWEWDRKFHVTVCQNMSADGNGVSVLVVDGNTSPYNFNADTDRKLLRFHFDTHPPALIGSWNLPPSRGMPPRIIPSRASFLVLDSQLFDLRSGIFYKLSPPEASSALRDGLVPGPFRYSYVAPDPPRYLLTKTHLIVFTIFHDHTVAETVHYDLFQAFALPDSSPPSDDAVSHLRLTHEALVPNERPSFQVALIHDSIIDPITLSTRFKFLKSSEGSQRLQFECVDVTLRNPSSFDDAPPISVQSEILYTTSSGLFNVPRSFAHTVFVCSSDDGHARVLFQVFGKFTIDASGDECKVVVGGRTRFRSLETDSELVQADCLRGKIYVTRATHDMKARELVIVNIE